MIWVALPLYSRIGKRKVVDPGLPRCTKVINHEVYTCDSESLMY